MRIVFLGPFGLRPKGTMQSRALPMAQALAQRGHVVTIIIPPWDYPSDSGHRENIGAVPIINVSLPPRIPVLWYAIVLFRMLRLAFAQHPQVIHAFKPKAFAGLAATVIWLMQRLRFTQVRLAVDSDDWEGTGGWNERGNYNWLLRAFFPIQEKWVLRHAQAVTAASRTLQQMVAALGLPMQHIFYVPNGVTDKYMATLVTKDGHEVRRRHSLGKGPVLLLYTRFVEFPVERVIKLWQHIRAQVGDAQLLVVGQGLFGEERALDKLALEADLNQDLSLAGWVEARELKDYFAAADVALYPMTDNLLNRAKCSVKLVELLSAGVPVVADAVGQAKEYIIPGNTGLLVEPGNDEAFAAAVAQLLRDKSLRRSLGEKARLRIHQHYTWQRWVTRLLEAYRA
ncbi:MAG: glycosyltransferase family 4 protein [Chloroflexi bacterium]|nr:glycosyltransferase family 4 protein [Chloroflexota bacterium]